MKCSSGLAPLPAAKTCNLPLKNLKMVSEWDGGSCNNRPYGGD
jgi:hypothetical protein